MRRLSLRLGLDRHGSHRTALFSAVFAIVASVPGLCTAAAVQWTIASGGNGHFYEFVLAPSSLTWTEASSEALSMGGYLVTITSSEEQAFLEANYPQSGSYWAGGSDAETEGVWNWVTGPEAGTQFWSGFSGGSTTPPFNYANWFPGEPNGTGEDYLVANFNASLIGWNDVTIDNSSVSRFIVESAVPEPAPALFVAGLVSLLALQRRIRARKAR